MSIRAGVSRPSSSANKIQLNLFGGSSEIVMGLLGVHVFSRDFFWFMLEALGIFFFFFFFFVGGLIFALIQLSPSLEILSTPLGPGRD